MQQCDQGRGPACLMQGGVWLQTMCRQEQDVRLAVNKAASGCRHRTTKAEGEGLRGGRSRWGRAQACTCPRHGYVNCSGPSERS